MYVLQREVRFLCHDHQTGAEKETLRDPLLVELERLGDPVLLQTGQGLVHCSQSRCRVVLLVQVMGLKIQIMREQVRVRKGVAQHF